MSRLSLVAAVGVALWALPVAAEDPSSNGLPSWASPSEPSARSQSSAPQAVPSPPYNGSAPKRLPVDGGLGLLALAGGAYAVRRLRSRS